MTCSNLCSCGIRIQWFLSNRSNAEFRLQKLELIEERTSWNDTAFERRVDEQKISSFLKVCRLRLRVDESESFSTLSVFTWNPKRTSFVHLFRRKKQGHVFVFRNHLTFHFVDFLYNNRDRIYMSLSIIQEAFFWFRVCHCRKQRIRLLKVRDMGCCGSTRREMKLPMVSTSSEVTQQVSLLNIPQYS